MVSDAHQPFVFVSFIRPCFVVVFFRGFVGVIPQGLGEINPHTKSPQNALIPSWLIPLIPHSKNAAVALARRRQMRESKTRGHGSVSVYACIE
jgi:hypothetical protein